MKKIILLFVLVFIMLSCTQEITDFGIVTKVELKNRSFTNGYTTKYKVIVKDFNAKWIDDVIVFTNELYIVGDTIKVTNPNNLNYEQRNQNQCPRRDGN